MFRTKKNLALAATLTLFSALPLVAHRSVPAEFNSDKTITLKSIVSKVDWDLITMRLDEELT